MRSHRRLSWSRPSRIAGAVAAIVAFAFAGACSKDATWNAPGETADPPKVTIDFPQDGATDVITAAELQFTLEGTQTAQVALADASGTAITGTMRQDGSSWLPDQQLDYGTEYTATVTATKSDGSSAAATTTFTTMGEPSRTARVQSFNGDNVTYGVGMPIIINFDINVPESARASIERRLFVTSTPAQEGSWHWISSYYHDAGSQVRYRPKDYWKPGTRVQARIALGGMPWGYEGVYGRNDLTLDFTIGDSQIIEVDNGTKRMTITVNGEVLDREITVSLGRPSLPSSSGHMLIMRREHPRVFDTTDRASGGYRTEVQYAEQITTSGEFIHDAPWSVAQQGNTNVSHGCLNVSPENGEWLYNFVRVGDPVIVTGTGQHLAWGDGFTDWDIPFDEYRQGSALYAPDAAPTSPTPSA